MQLRCPFLFLVWILANSLMLLACSPAGPEPKAQGADEDSLMQTRVAAEVVAARATAVAEEPAEETIMVVSENGLTINEEVPRTSLFKLNTLAYELPGMDVVEVVNITYAHRGDTPLTMDVYYPPGATEGDRLPVVVFGLGYRMSKEPLRNAHFYTSWGKLVAAAGMVGIVYDTEQPDQDLEALMTFLRENAVALRLDENQIGFWSSSSNVPTVMSYLMQEGREGIQFSVYYYGFSLTPDRKYTEEFAQSCLSRGCLVNELADVSYVDPELRLFVVKAGQDFRPIVNEAVDHFIAYVREAGAPVTVVDYEEGVHGFDTEQKTEASAEIIAQTVNFMQTAFGMD